MNEQAPQKKSARGNQLSFMNKIMNQLCKGINSESFFFENRTEENRNNYAKQGSLWVALLRKNKGEFYSNLNEKKLCDNKKFWGVVKPILSNKIVSNEKK